MIQASLTFNDWLQWATVAAILIIVAITVVRKIVRFNRAMKHAKDDDSCNCGCGCSGCATPCDLKETHRKSKGKR